MATTGIGRVGTLDTFRRAVHGTGESVARAHIFPLIESSPVSRFKSASDMVCAAEMVKERLVFAGVENARVIQHDGCYPAVFGEIRSDHPDAPTILVGGHFDGQPSSSTSWSVTDPHKPKLITQGGETRVFGRGTSDDWGQVLTHIIAVKTLRDLGIPLPVNIKFLIEGGEEVGSTNMDKFIEAHKDLLKADLVILTDSAPGREAVPVITTMARGLVGADVELKFGTNNPHSGLSLTYSAVDVLAKLLDLKDLRTMRVAIPGFYAKVRPTSDPVIARLIKMPYDVALFKASNGLKDLVTLDGCSAQEAMWAQPTYQVHTITDSDDNGLPPVNQLPTSVKAYVTMRLVADMDPLEIFELFRAEVYCRLEKLTLLPRDALSVKMGHIAYPFATEVSDPRFDAVALSMSAAFGVQEIDFGGCGGTEPIAIYYQKILGVPVVFNAYNSPKDNYHGHDESFSLTSGFEPGVVSNMLIYQKLAELAAAQRAVDLQRD